MKFIARCVHVRRRASWLGVVVILRAWVLVSYAWMRDGVRLADIDAKKNDVGDTNEPAPTAALDGKGLLVKRLDKIID